MKEIQAGYALSYIHLYMKTDISENNFHACEVQQDEGFRRLEEVGGAKRGLRTELSEHERMTECKRGRAQDRTITRQSA